MTFIMKFYLFCIAGLIVGLCRNSIDVNLTLMNIAFLLFSAFRLFEIKHKDQNNSQKPQS